MLVSAMTGGIAAASVGPAAETDGEHAVNSKLMKIITGKCLVFMVRSWPFFDSVGWEQRLQSTIELPILYSFRMEVGVG
jgi:hypothetical protein